MVNSSSIDWTGIQKPLGYFSWIEYLYKDICRYEIVMSSSRI